MNLDNEQWDAVVENLKQAESLLSEVAYAEQAKFVEARKMIENVRMFVAVCIQIERDRKGLKRWFGRE